MRQHVLDGFNELAEAHADLAVLVHEAREHKENLFRAGAESVLALAYDRVERARDDLAGYLAAL